MDIVTKINQPNDFEVIGGISDLALEKNYFIIDLWGVLHDGQAAYPKALECMKKLAEAGKQIILLSNAPRRAAKAVEVLENLGFTHDLYSKLITSGELAFEAVEGESELNNYYYIGPEKDRDILDGLSKHEVTTPDEADFAIATGFDGFGSVFEEKKGQLDECLSADLPLICANPDRKVVKQNGETLICAGLMGQYYEQNGGEVIYFGKPFGLAYKACFDFFGNPHKDEICCIGDSLHTDIAGGNISEIDSVLCASGILREEIVEGEGINLNNLTALIEKEGSSPDYVIYEFKW